VVSLFFFFFNETQMIGINY